jgi:hypothetical protein
VKHSPILLVSIIFITVGIIAGDLLYASKFEQKFIELERERIITSNKLATAKIVYENLNHVRDLVFKNMDFPGQRDSISSESIFFDFLTTCLNDLKLKLISIRPARPQTTGQITTLGYDLEIEGDFFKFGELCSKFENSRRIISLENFSVDLLNDRTTVGGNNSGVRVRMRVNTYRVKKGVEMPPLLTPRQLAAQKRNAAR